MHCGVYMSLTSSVVGCANTVATTRRTRRTRYVYLQGVGGSERPAQLSAMHAHSQVPYVSCSAPLCSRCCGRFSGPALLLYLRGCDSCCKQSPLQVAECATTTTHPVHLTLHVPPRCLHSPIPPHPPCTRCCVRLLPPQQQRSLEARRQRISAPACPTVWTHEGTLQCVCVCVCVMGRVCVCESGWVGGWVEGGGSGTLTELPPFARVWKHVPHMDDVYPSLTVSPRTPNSPATRNTRLRSVASDRDNIARATLWFARCDRTFGSMSPTARRSVDCAAWRAHRW